MVTNNILNPRKIEGNKRQSRNIGFEADLLIILKFPYDVFFTTSLRLHSERLTAFYDKSSLKLIHVRRGYDLPSET